MRGNAGQVGDTTDIGERMDKWMGMRGTSGARRARLGLVAVLLLVVASVLGACASGQTAKQPAGTPTATPPPPGTVLFQADFTKGLDAWKPTGGWTLDGETLVITPVDMATLTFPYTVPVRDFAVEYTVQVVSIPADGGYFQLIAPQTPGSDGWSAEVNGLLGPNRIRNTVSHPDIRMMLDPTDHMVNYQVHDFEPTFNARPYRVEVKGNTATLFVDGRHYSSATSSAARHVSNGPLRFEVGGATLRISGIRITAL